MRVEESFPAKIMSHPLDSMGRWLQAYHPRYKRVTGSGVSRVSHPDWW